MLNNLVSIFAAPIGAPSLVDYLVVGGGGGGGSYAGGGGGAGGFRTSTNFTLPSSFTVTIGSGGAGGSFSSGSVGNPSVFSSITSAGGGGGGGSAFGVGGGAGGSGAGASGGSGVVILRWLTSNGTITVGSGLTADATGTDGSWSYKRFTAGTGTVSIA